MRWIGEGGGGQLPELPRHGRHRPVPVREEAVKTKRCDCGQEMVFLPTKKSSMPVNVESLSDGDVEALNRGDSVPFRYGEHISHFSDCPNAKGFRR